MGDKRIRQNSIGFSETNEDFHYPSSLYLKIERFLFHMKIRLNIGSKLWAQAILWNISSYRVGRCYIKVVKISVSKYCLRSSAKIAFFMIQNVSGV